LQWFDHAALTGEPCETRRIHMAGLHVFDAYVDAANAWLRALIEDLELPPGEHARALQALRAGLHAIRDRLPAAEAVDLAAQLPTLLRGVFYEGWRLDNDPTRIRDRAAMLARVEKELGADPRFAPYDVLRSVIRLLVTHVSPGEIRDVVATLPRHIATLWEELSRTTAEGSVGPPAQGRVRRTGYVL
jgi:uncharacterized protein (DUF2267 family)